ncbi:ATP-binding protein [Streptomyces sp. NPDC056716]|uniref:ATP-binding protein n=1 Tax=unclassified Streptomyces TaxID=2593676 RepID=UPI0036BACAAB
MTTAVRSRAVPHRDGTVMDERIQVAPRDLGAQLPRVEAERVGVLRRLAAARLRYIGLESLIDPTVLVVSELMTNALEHSGTREIRLTMVLGDGVLHILVIDGMPGAATPVEQVGETAESGRGLLMVQAVAAEHGGTWGTGDGGAQTWCRLAVPAEESC